MILSDIARPDSKFFIKSEWGLASDDWPAVSFSKQAVGRRMRAIYDPTRDFVIYVGTTNARNTPEPTHRSRLLSLVRMDLRTEYKTRDLIPAESWASTQAEHGDRWMYSFAILQAWTLDELPSAYKYIPNTYGRLANPATFGDFVQVEGDEAIGLGALSVLPITLKMQVAGKQAQSRTDFLNASKDLKAEIYRMAALIEQRALASNTVSIRLNKLREANPRTETMEMLFKMWESQKGFCGLCQGAIAMPAREGLLQPSPDRIDSLRPDYSPANMHITHLGCNYAKNKFDVDAFEDWLAVIRGAEI